LKDGKRRPLITDAGIFCPFAQTLKDSPQSPVKEFEWITFSSVSVVPPATTVDLAIDEMGRRDGYTAVELSR